MPTYSLAQIKSHPDFPFAGFRENPLSFLMLELYWTELFRDIAGGILRDWMVLADAAPDGNPILSVVNCSNARALRIIQKVNDEGKPRYPDHQGEGAYYDFQAWLNTGYLSDGEVELNELVLFADVSTQAEREARALIRLHCVELASVAVVEDAIRAFENRVGMPE